LKKSLILPPREKKETVRTQGGENYTVKRERSTKKILFPVVFVRIKPTENKKLEKFSLQKKGGGLGHANIRTNSIETDSKKITFLEKCVKPDLRSVVTSLQRVFSPNCFQRPCPRPSFTLSPRNQRHFLKGVLPQRLWNETFEGKMFWTIPNLGGGGQRKAPRFLRRYRGGFMCTKRKM